MNQLIFLIIIKTFTSGEILSRKAEYIYLCAYFIFATVAYLHWAVLVIKRFCLYLKIKCFSIPYGKQGPKKIT
jgi:ethanolaminephosphotransferase